MFHTAAEWMRQRRQRPAMSPRSLPVRAPITGAVVHFDSVLGPAIPADESLFEIHDVSRPWVQAFLSERESAQAPVGTPVRIRLAADPAFLASGKVVRSARTFGDENRTLSVWIELIEPQGVTLRQNMLARVSATLNTAAPAIAVPRAAIVREGTRNYVFIQQDDGTLDRRAIETGRADDRFVQITRGLKLQEKIAVHGSAELQTAYASLR